MNNEEMYIKRAETGEALKKLALKLESQKQYDKAKGVRKAIDRMMQVPVIYVDRGGTPSDQR